VAKRNPGRRSRSRKRRPDPQAQPPSQLAVEPKRASKRAVTKAASPPREAGAVGERPQAPWHPLPLSELLILVGGIGTVIAIRRGEVENGGTALLASLGAVMIGTLEVTLREHLSGYRSHTLILSLLPTIVFHSSLVLILAQFIQVPRWVTSALLALDLALFAFLFKVLRARFLDARRERVFAARR
jgi:hypothetical protein